MRNSFLLWLLTFLQHARKVKRIGISVQSSSCKSSVLFILLLFILKANDKGDYFPIWGTCLGHEELTYLTSNKVLLVNTKTTGLALPLNFTSGEKFMSEFC